MISFPWDIGIGHLIYRRDSIDSQVQEYEVTFVGQELFETESTGNVSVKQGESWINQPGGTRGKVWNPTQGVLDYEYREGLVMSPITHTFFDKSR